MLDQDLYELELDISYWFCSNQSRNLYYRSHIVFWRIESTVVKRFFVDRNLCDRFDHASKRLLQATHQLDKSKSERHFCYAQHIWFQAWWVCHSILFQILIVVPPLWSRLLVCTEDLEVPREVYMVSLSWVRTTVPKNWIWKATSCAVAGFKSLLCQWGNYVRDEASQIVWTRYVICQTSDLYFLSSHFVFRRT